MPSIESITSAAPAGTKNAIPTGYAAIPIDEQQAGAALRICVLCKLKPDPTGGALVVLRDHLDARVFLGCIVDAAGRPLDWIEIWTQNVDSVGASLGVVREALNNVVLDKRWQEHSDAIEKLDPVSIVLTGFEKLHPRPTWIDLTTILPCHDPDGCVEQPGDSWQLCTDDAVLKDVGLEPYTTSLQRYLYRPDAKASDGFRPAASGFAPSTAQADAGLTRIPFNAGAGLLQVRRYRPLALDAFADVLSGAPPRMPLHGRSALPLDVGLPPEDAAGLSEAWMFLGRHGQLGRTLEAFHLKLRLLADAVTAVRAMIERMRRPLLNLTIDHFRIEIGPSGAGLPRLWTARAVLAEPGCAVELSIPNSDLRYYLQGSPVGQSIYLPAQIDSNVAGRASVRIRKVLNHVSGGLVVEGTLATQERISPSPSDLVWLRLTLSGMVLDLYAHLEAEPALARGEWRFRTTPQRFPDAVAAGIRAAEGIPLGRTPFELIPLLSSPCDLYSLAVIAVRILLVDSQTTLPMALDEVMSLARELSHGHDRAVPIRTRIGAIFDGDERWRTALGPQRLSYDPTTADALADLIPSKLWWDTLGVIVSMLPGMGHDSLCCDLGDARPGSQHQIFDRVLAELGALLVQTRSLIMIDWRYNREIYAIIRQREMGVQSTTVARRPAKTIVPEPRPAPVAPRAASGSNEPQAMRMPRNL